MKTEEIERKKREEIMQKVLSKGSSTSKLISNHLVSHSIGKESAADEAKRRWSNIVQSTHITENLSKNMH